MNYNIPSFLEGKKSGESDTIPTVSPTAKRLRAWERELVRNDYGFASIAWLPIQVLRARLRR
jgi:hypothetical protein